MPGSVRLLGVSGLSRRHFITTALAVPVGLSLGGNTAPPSRFVIAGGEATQGGWLRGSAPAGTIALAFDGRPIPLAPDNSFFVAFDRDAAPEHLLAATLSDGATTADLPITVTPRAWRIEQVNVPLRPGKLPDAEFQRLRAGELARIASARQLQTNAQGWRQAFDWPAKGRISGRFGSQRVYQGKPGAYHSGLDIAAVTGTPFTAPADGVVILAAEAPFTLEGRLLMVDHGMGLNSAFLHCNALLVKEGDSVSRGQPLGQIGATGRATGPHLHWSLKWNESRLDPLLFARPATAS